MSPKSAKKSGTEENDFHAMYALVHRNSKLTTFIEKSYSLAYISIIISNRAVTSTLFYSAVSKVRP